MVKKMIMILKSFPKLSETFILQELVLLHKNGFELFLFARNKTQDEPVTHTMLEDLNIEVKYIPEVKWFRFYSIFLTMLIKFKSKRVWRLFVETYKKSKNGISKKRKRFCFYGALYIIKELKIDAKNSNYHIHSQFIDFIAEIAHNIHQLTGIEYSISSHAKDLYTTSKDDIIKYAESANKIKTCTEYNKNYLKELAGNNLQIERVYHGIDCDFFSKRKLQSKIRLISVARFVEKKGYKYILGALDILRNKYPDFIYTIIGHGVLYEDIQSLINSMSLQKNIQIIQYATQEIVRDYLSINDIFINASVITKNGDRDGIPNSIAEAMAMEVPVVGTAVSGITELIKHKITGYLAESYNPESLYEGIIFYLENKDEKDKIIENARAFVNDNFCSKNVFDNCKLFYESVLNEKN
jgi:glycosyltransferase involved in cell wall biosynthesis